VRPMSTFVKERELSIGDLEKVVRTGKPIEGIGKMRALTALQRRAGPDATGALQRVASSKKEDSTFRHMAIVSLYRMAGRDSRAALLKIARTATGEPAADIAMVLGRIGEPDDRPLIVRLTKLAPAHARKRARFGLALLDYRYGEKSAALQLKDVKPGRSRVREWQPIALGAPQRKDLEEVSAALEREPLGFELALSRARKITCLPNTYIWVSTPEAEPETLLRRNCVAGALFRRNDIMGTYSLSLLGLATAKAGAAILTLHRPESGDVIYCGEVASNGAWKLASTSWPGLAPVQINGNVDRAEIAFEAARSATSVQTALKPKSLKPKVLGPRVVKPKAPRVGASRPRPKVPPSPKS